MIERKIKSLASNSLLLAITLRKAQKEDWDLILDLRNEFYHFFYKQNKPITKAEHYKYMEKQQSNPQFHQWIINLGNEIVGYVRLLENDVGIIIKKEYQNRGIASEALKLVEKQARNFGIRKLVALIKIENENSKKLFIKNNYELKIYWFEKKLV